MGTRGLTVIIKDKTIKLANYQQWDSYFDYTGVKFLEFCKKHLNTEQQIEKFKDNVDLLIDVSKDEEYLKKVNDTLDYFRHSNKKYFLGINEMFPQFSRDTGVKILDIINNLYSFEFNDKKYPIIIESDLGWIEYINVLDLDEEKVYMLRLGDNSLETNKIIKENYIDKGFECYLSYKLSNIPSIKKATEQYKLTLPQEDSEEIPF